jgi:uracil phosphoribosyltransferase
MVINLSREYSVINDWLSELRDANIQTDRMRFRKNVERIGEIIAFEISKTLPYKTVDIQTPLGIHKSKVLKEQPIIAGILRAGLPMHQGILNYFDKADNAFVSAYRKHFSDDSFEIRLEYLSCPPLDNRILIVADPMLATGASLIKTIEALKAIGLPAQIHIAAIIASTEGIKNVQEKSGEDIHIWCGDIDNELTSKGYIVPGLGDAGDLLYGMKTQ